MIDKIEESRPDYTGEDYENVTIETYFKTVGDYATTVKLEYDYIEIHFPSLRDVEEFKKTIRDCGLTENEDLRFLDNGNIYWAGTNVSIKGSIVTLEIKWAP